MHTSRQETPVGVAEIKDDDHEKEPLSSQPTGRSSGVLRWLWVGIVVSAAIAVLLGTLLLLRPSQGANQSQLLGTDLGGTSAPTFNLVDQQGKIIDLSQLHGHPIMLTFFDSVCPHTDCSLMANYINMSARQMSSAERSQVIWLAISLNPWHDTPTTVKTFLTSHGVSVPVHYLLGSVSQLAPVWGNYHIQSVLQPNGIVIHTTGVYVIDQQGRERVFLDEGFDPHMLSGDLHLLLTSHPSVNAQQAAQTDGSVTLTKTVAGGTVSLQAMPDDYGTYSYIVWLWDAKGRPLANGAAALDLSMPDMVMQPLHVALKEDSSIGPGIYRATGVLSMAGQWVAVVSAGSPAMAGGAAHTGSAAPAIQATFTFTSKY
jgi:cytochrome oxidase Cu insertion factor (SCO1/SenC/PrrC family)